MKADYDLEERLLEYAARIIRLVERLPDSRAVRGSRFGVGCSTFLFPWQADTCKLWCPKRPPGHPRGN